MIFAHWAIAMIILYRRLIDKKCVYKIQVLKLIQSLVYILGYLVLEYKLSLTFSNYKIEKDELEKNKCLKINEHEFLNEVMVKTSLIALYRSFESKLFAC